MNVDVVIVLYLYQWVNGTIRSYDHVGVGVTLLEVSHLGSGLWNPPPSCLEE